MSKRDEQVEKIADMFFEAIKNGTAPWQKEWKADDFRKLSHNPASNNIYKGMNALLLDMVALTKGYDEKAWLTFKQAKDLDGNIKKGEKATTVSFFTMLEVKEEDKKNKDNEKEYIPVTKYFSVFNIDQTENINQDKLKALYKDNDFEKKDFINIEECQKVLDNVNDVRIIHQYQDRAYYNSSKDTIVLPEKEQFINPEAYYSTAFHELGHSTGHSSRLDRKVGNKFGTDDYAREEIKVEIYSFLQAKELGMDFSLVNHQNYIDSWTRQFTDKKTEIIEAVKDSLKIVDYVNDKYINKVLNKEEIVNENETEKLNKFSEKFNLNVDEKITLKDLVGDTKSDNKSLNEIKELVKQSETKTEQTNTNTRRNK